MRARARMCVCVVCECEGVYELACIYQRSQHPFGVISQVLSALYFEAESLVDLRGAHQALTMGTMLAGQWVPGIYLFLPPQSWDYR